MQKIIQNLYDAVRPASGPVLVEQLKLVAGHRVNGVGPVGFMVFLLWWMLSDQVDLMPLSLWGTLMVTGLCVSYLQARQNLRDGITSEQAPAIVRRLVLERIFYSTGWGGLGFMTLGSVSANYTLLVLAGIAGMTSGAVAAFSPVLLLYVMTIIPTFALITLKVCLLGDPFFYVLGTTFIVYMLFLLGQAIHSSKQTRGAIDLRFENNALLQKLHAETELTAAALRNAQEANTAKSMFLAAASHDLRQPIHAQGLFLDVLSRTTLEPRQRELLNSTIAIGESSVEMLNTLLDFSRIEAGVIEPQIHAFYVQPILNKIEREFSQQADAKGLTYRSRESALAVFSDPHLIELLLRNLVSNAIKYTPHGGVLVNFRRKGVMAILEVWDTGVGIAESHHKSIFREFHQLANPERDRNKGLGLGLAIVQGLAQSLGLRLSLRSVVGRGSVFRLELPLAIDSPPQVATQATPREQFLPNVRVLVLDDDSVICAGMVQLLSDWSCVCGVANTMEAALVLAPNFQPDVVISDYRLQADRTGLAAILALRDLLRKDLPALLITGDTGPERLREALSSGFPVLHKPVSSSQLFHALIAVLPE